MNFCGTCRFWEFKHKPDDDYASGECRRHAPRPEYEILTDLGNLLGLITQAVEQQAKIESAEIDYFFDNQEVRKSGWPRTMSCDWCGEYQVGDRPSDFWERCPVVDQWEKTDLPATISAHEEAYNLRKYK